MPPWKLSIEAVKMTFPAPRAIIPRPSSRLSTNWLVRSTCKTRFQSSSEWSTAGARAMVPALLTRMSTEQSRPLIASTRWRTASGSARSAVETGERAARTTHTLLELAALGLEGDAHPDDVRARLSQRLRHRQSDAAAGAGDDVRPDR